jgi:c-di-GMP-related signal transduction protein
MHGFILALAWTIPVRQARLSHHSYFGHWGSVQMHAFVARQPIFTNDQRVFGYELLFRSSPANVFCAADGELATARLIEDSVHLHGLRTLSNGQPCFINLTRQALLDDLYSVLPPQTTVIEILETVEPDQNVLAACRRARDAGYRIALDDYTLQDHFEPILKLIDILKVEYPLLSFEQHREIRRLRRRYGFQLLAEKLEDPKAFHQARSFGYDLFQGFFFCKPEVLSTRRMPASRLNYLRLLQAVNREETEIAEIEQLLRQEVSLSYKLLRYINSAGFGLRNGVKSIRHAISLLGRRPMRKWASIVTATGLCDGKSPELMRLCLTRARFGELLSEREYVYSPASDLFMLGMFSLLDAILDRPMNELVEEMALPDEVRRTLVGEPTPLKLVLDLISAFEHGNWTISERVSRSQGLSELELYQLYIDSIAWSNEILRELLSYELPDTTLRAAS